ncbi:MAG: exodeoxyribonuclease VII small subunit [Planctomycetota bacterium]
MKASNPQKSGGDAPNFEERIDKLRRIVDELEKGELPLEQAIERYEEGVRVLKTCAETLTKARLRVEELSRDADGVLGLKHARELEDSASGTQNNDTDSENGKDEDDN